MALNLLFDLAKLARIGLNADALGPLLAELLDLEP